MYREVFGLVMVSVLLLTNSSISGSGLDVSPDQTHLLLATKRTSTMQEELDAAASLGFRVRMGAPASNEQVGFLLEKSGASAPSGHYLLLATNRVSTMRQEMNQAARAGYRFIPETAMWVDCELVLLMERKAREDAGFFYEILSTERTSTLEKEVRETVSRGYEPVAMLQTDENLVILERIRDAVAVSLPFPE